jgi:hypothetical protein
VETVVEAGVDLAIVFIGANDVTTRVSETLAARQLAEAVRALRAAGAEVVVATCPDLGAIVPIKPPLRWAARYWSRQLAAAQTVAVVQAGGRSVSLGDLVGPQFAAAPDRMFGADRYHPSAEGYRLAASVVLPSALAALGLAPERAEPLGDRPSLPDAAAAAAARPGTEVRPADVDRSRPPSAPGPTPWWPRWRPRPRQGAAEDAALVVPSVTGAESPAGWTQAAPAVVAPSAAD